MKKSNSDSFLLYLYRFFRFKTSLLALGGLVGFEFTYDEVDRVEHILVKLSITILVKHFVLMLSNSLADQGFDCLLGHS